MAKINYSENTSGVKQTSAKILASPSSTELVPHWKVSLRLKKHSEYNRGFSVII